MFFNKIRSAVMTIKTKPIDKRWAWFESPSSVSLRILVTGVWNTKNGPRWTDLHPQASICFYLFLYRLSGQLHKSQHLSWKTEWRRDTPHCSLRIWHLHFSGPMIYRTAIKTHWTSIQPCEQRPVPRGTIHQSWASQQPRVFTL